MKEFILLVTWFISGQTGSSYTATFTSKDTCEAARVALAADEAAMAKQQDADNKAMKRAGAAVIIEPRSPRLSAVCVER
jgi:hypothetical protein